MPGCYHLNRPGARAAAWRSWLVADQRFVDGRPDELTYMSEPLQDAVTVRGTVTANLCADTTGADEDWVVKLIDVFPDQDAAKPDMSSYQFMISGDVLRGRDREGFSDAKPTTQPSARYAVVTLKTLRRLSSLSKDIQSRLMVAWPGESWPIPGAVGTTSPRFRSTFACY